jgi:transposase
LRPELPSDVEYQSCGTIWLATKRLSKGRFRWWPQSNDASKPLRVHEAQVLLAAGNPEIDAAPVWRPV